MLVLCYFSKVYLCSIYIHFTTLFLYMEIPFNSPEMLGVSVSPPTWNIIGSCLLLSSSHWPRRCQSSNLTCEASLQLYTRAGGTSGLVVASYREQGKKRECYLSAYIVAEVTAGGYFWLFLVSLGVIFLTCAAGIICCLFWRCYPQHTVDEEASLLGFFMARRVNSVCLAWLRLLHRPPRNRYGF